METLEMLSKVYVESTMARFKIYEWHRRFRQGRESIEYNEHAYRPPTSRNAENVALVSECVRKDRNRQIIQATHFSKRRGNPYVATRGLLATDHVILNHGQVTWTTPELAPPSPNYHTTPTGGRFSSRQI
ncbi:hypothetical protein TNCV_4792091 [Trichonephila clavipes]|nr:hypothetical protein TNCV_4792091 [Trichonephila clavipes]